MQKNGQLRSGFTILELMVATGVLVLLTALLTAVNNDTMKLCRRTTAQADAFQSARLAFDLMIRQLNQATLNVYWDYDNPVAPTRYLRKSDLAFVTGQAATLLPSTGSQPRGPGQALFFQAPLGRLDAVTTRQLNLLLNTCGFYVEYADANAGAPMPRPVRNRYRLMQLQTSGEKMKVSGSAATNPPANSWFNDYLGESRVLAENIVLLVVRPLNQNRVDLGYVLDSREGEELPTQPATSNQLPPLVSLTLVAVSEESMNRKNPTDGYRISTQGMSLFSNTADYDSDLAVFLKELKDANLDYRLFSQQIALPASKWSE